jgi:hypothetical protein
MPEKPRPTPRVQIFHPGDYDREQIARARNLIKLAKKILAESDPSTLLGDWYKPEPRSERQ